MRVIIKDSIEEEMYGWLKVAQEYAKYHSGCLKVRVGSVIIKEGKAVSLGANKSIPDLCKGDRGCLRIEKYGNNSKNHREPSDCRAIHSEIDAISKSNESLQGATIYITRYPCEACARAIVVSGIEWVVYGRDQEISEETHQIFKENKVEVHNFSSFKEDDDIG